MDNTSSPLPELTVVINIRHDGPGSWSVTVTTKCGKRTRMYSEVGLESRGLAMAYANKCIKDYFDLQEIA